MNDIDRKKLEKVKALAREGKIRFSEHGKVDASGAEIQRVLDAIATVVDEPGICRAWVSDGSMPSDFCLEPEDYARLATVLGVPVSEDDYLWQVAERLAPEG